MTTKPCNLRRGVPSGRLRCLLWRTIRARGFPFVAVLVLLAALVVSSPPARSAAIVNGGTPASAPSWTVGLDNVIDTCSGVFIGPDLVLTAAHCLNDGIDEDALAFIGRRHFDDLSQGVSGDIRGSVRHGQLDLAVVRLASSVNLAPIQISSEDFSAGRSEIPVTVYGYGRITDLAQAPIFDETLHTAVGLTAACEDTSFRPPLFCLQAQGIQAPCQGDSGAPLVNPQGQLVGIYLGRTVEADNRRCVGARWRGIAVGAKDVRTWIDDMLRRHDEL